MYQNVTKALRTHGREDLAIAVEVAAAEPRVLAELLPVIQALAHFYQHAHWVSAGPNAYGDHLLYQRLYEGTAEEIDTLGEKVLGIGGSVDMAKTVHAAGAFLDQWVGPKPNVALKVEQALIEKIKKLMGVPWSDGVQNMLQGIADKHESHIYLLRQRIAQA